jgi:hypothetical protein
MVHPPRFALLTRRAPPPTQRGLEHDPENGKSVSGRSWTDKSWNAMAAWNVITLQKVSA